MPDQLSEEAGQPQARAFPDPALGMHAMFFHPPRHPTAWCGSKPNFFSAATNRAKGVSVESTNAAPIVAPGWCWAAVRESKPARSASLLAANVPVRWSPGAAAPSPWLRLRCAAGVSPPFAHARRASPDSPRGVVLARPSRFPRPTPGNAGTGRHSALHSVRGFQRGKGAPEYVAGRPLHPPSGVAAAKPACHARAPKTPGDHVPCRSVGV
ncbi:hypothetical protein CGC21_5240 [Leishmania donovani]|uniref:Uncharacterized protein n=1 Tax=Leishmania donovani TaxID=5661 RepID=A0A504XTD4_LEIDO|nr:hypothetical protein CGC21_5240 [Leishmania donovani]